MASICAAVHTMTFVFSSAHALPERQDSIKADSPKTSSVLYTLMTISRPLFVVRPTFTFPDMTRKYLLQGHRENIWLGLAQKTELSKRGDTSGGPPYFS